MAIKEHLEALMQGIEVWNKWREEYPDVWADLSEADLSGANLSGVYFINANLSQTDLRVADLRRAYLRRVDLGGANLGGADLSGANLIEADLNGANLAGAYLSRANLREANLSQANLTGAYLSRANLREADLSRANLSGAYVSGVDLSGANLREADLNGANLSGADFNGAYLSQANLSGANLIEVDLSRANLSRANLSGADLSRANLSGAKFRETDLIEADLIEANLSRADFIEADLSRANLQRSTLVKTNFMKANLTGCLIYGISAWDLNLEHTTQLNLVITPPPQPTIRVDDLEVAQFIYLLLNYKKLRNMLNIVTDRGVLILGRFGDGGLELLQAIAANLRELNYLPIIIDFEKKEDRNYTETIKTLAGLSRFVIADLSGPAVPQELYTTVPHFKIPFVPIIKKGRKKFAIVDDILEYPWVLTPVEFENQEHLLELLPATIIDPAEKKHQERQNLLDQLF